MEELIKQLEERLKMLNIGYENQVRAMELAENNMHAQEGAIQECQLWLDNAKKALNGGE